MSLSDNFMKFFGYRKRDYNDLVLDVADVINNFLPGMMENPYGCIVIFKNHTFAWVAKKNYEEIYRIHKDALAHVYLRDIANYDSLQDVNPYDERNRQIILDISANVVNKLFAKLKK